MDIYESDLPGVGKKHEVELEDDARLVIITHNTGKREIYRKESPDADGERLFELSDRLARTVGTILEGAYFQPVETEQVETLLSDETLIEWYNVDDGAELVGQSLADANVRERTGVSVVAIQRGDDVLSPPEPTDVIQTGDTVVIVGAREDCQTFESLVSGDDA
ncbi:putative regulatory ligand binding protein, C-terminal domain of K+ channels like protein [Halovivax ruber XH-70]|uniref:Putative regulatory ligand binding protein, C-terminal domain of K+ channels like protein n=1 Tax=Halovivax ruber (strain DSM 18193 / JCM 13892 / XH-70) TaxID=797302 RepID=L0IAQ9_HALRX|nr:TrkA C-terminal domain-containing protein [Halovivax ruber]AGB16680.1 putative regulatory ligand binding protein, C-terminal domain of K+ channels like protein [Halovivax ruber XH-70]